MCWAVFFDLFFLWTLCVYSFLNEKFVACACLLRKSKEIFSFSANEMNWAVTLFKEEFLGTIIKFEHFSTECRHIDSYHFCMWMRIIEIEKSFYIYFSHFSSYFSPLFKEIACKLALLCYEWNGIDHTSYTCMRNASYKAHTFVIWMNILHSFTFFSNAKHSHPIEVSIWTYLLPASFLTNTILPAAHHQFKKFIVIIMRL